MQEISIESKTSSLICEIMQDMFAQHKYVGANSSSASISKRRIFRQTGSVACVVSPGVVQSVE